MTVSLKHATEATGTDAGNGEIAKAQWNEEHALTGTAGTLLGFDGSGDAEEVAKPAGDLVGTTAVQTLTNKLITDTVYALSGTTPDIDPANGAIQTWTLTGASTPTESLASGQSVLLVIDDGASNTITWTIVDNWLTDDGNAPTLLPGADNHILIYKIGATVWGAKLGDRT